MESREFPIPFAMQQLDNLPFTLSDDERAFLREVVDDDEDVVKARVEAVRRS